MANTKSSDHASTPPKIHGHLQAGQTPCRNILIHGYCKYADKGCVFKHDSQQSQSPSPAPAFKRKLNAESPSFTPSFTNLANASGTLKSSALSPKFADISPFIPKNFNGQGSGPSTAQSNGSAKPFTPENTFPRPQFKVPDLSRINLNAEQPVSAPLVQNHMVSDYSQLQVDPMMANSAPLDYPPYAQPEMYYSHHTAFPLQYHLYAPSNSQQAGDSSLASHQRRPEDFFISNSLREELQRKNEATLQTLPGSNLPEYVHVYHSLVPIDTNLEKSTRVFGYPTWAYKACSNKDGRMYCLRRIEGYRLTNEKAISIVQVWNSISSANLVGLHEAFTTRAFGDSSLVFVYEYYPMSKTLADVHFGPESYQQMNRMVMPENLIWGYLTQIASALKVIHGAGLAARLLEPSRILVTGHSRIRLNCCGIFDVLHYESGQPVEELQQEDIKNLGRLLLVLANCSLGATKYMDTAIEYVDKFYSRQLAELVGYIFNPRDASSGSLKISDIVSMSADHILDSFNDSLVYSSYLESELSKELENGRVVRLLCKFGLINERPEFDHDPAWSDTGERYPIKLFRDFLFHQEDEQGKPVLDMAHILRHLNKLDAGIEESIMLVSRDEQTCLVITYRELKMCIESAFRELKR